MIKQIQVMSPIVFAKALLRVSFSCGAVLLMIAERAIKQNLWKPNAVSFGIGP